MIETQPVTLIIIRIGEDQRWAADAQESGWLRRAWARNREDGKARWGAHGISRILRSELPGRLVTRAASGKEEEAVKKGGTDGGRESRRKGRREGRREGRIGGV